MITYTKLKRYPSVFSKMTGLRVEEFDQWVQPVLQRFAEAETSRLTQRTRQRALGGGDHPQLEPLEQIILTLVWLRLYPVHEVLGFLFGVSQPTVGRYLSHVLPVLEQLGLDSLRQPDPGKKRRRSLPKLLKDVPELNVIVDSLEQPVQRPKQAADRPRWFSGKKRSATMKTQVAVEQTSGVLVWLSDSVPGPTADITLLKHSGLLAHLPSGVGCLGDSAYQGIAKLHPLGRSPFKRNKRTPPLTEAQRDYNHAFSSVRIVVENTICRLRHFQCLTQRDRQHRCTHNHHARICAVAGLVNFQLQHRFAF